jgi:uncharacterized membrane protein YjgN (DUF898 family)
MGKFESYPANMKRGSMQITYKLIFRGKLSADLSAPEVRERLLKLYGNKAEVADRFFTGRPLIVRKDLDYGAAQKYKAMFERAGVPCDVLEVRPPLPRAETQKQAAPQDDTAGHKDSGGKPQATAASVGTQTGMPRQGKVPSGKSMSSPGKQAAPKPSGSLLKGSKTQNILAVVMISLILVSAGARIWAMNAGRGIHPPDHVSANGNEFSLHSNGAIFFLTYEGRLVQRVPLQTLGMKREPADMQLLKNGDFIIGDLEKGEIRRCERGTLACRRIGPEGDYTIRENFKFLADEERNLLFISDTNNHALLVQGLDGTGLKKIEGRTQMYYPSGLVEDKEGRLWLSNTAKEEVISFEFRDEGIVQAEGAVSLRPESDEVRKIEEALKQKPSGKAGNLKDFLAKFRELRKVREKLGGDAVHRRPLAAAWDGSGNLWVAASDGFVTTAGVRVFDPAGNQITRIPLGKGAIPVDVAAAGDRILIADSGLFEVFSVLQGTYAPAVFGDAAFRRELTTARNMLRSFDTIKTWAGRGIWLLALGTIFLVVLIVVKNFERREQTAALARAAARNANPAVALTEGATPGIAKQYKLEFTGTGAEYFRIWIVNVFLTILTLGVYGAWAKVRTRSYFYRNTVLGGHPFDYTADPVALLKGYGIVAAGLLLYNLVKYFNPLYSLAVLGLLSLVIPLLIYKSLRFFTRNSTYRNIPFRFLGSLGESYRTYLFYPLLLPFTLGLIAPYWAFRRKKYFFGNVGYGSTANTFSGKHGPFYSVYIKMGLVLFLFFFVASILAALVIPKIAGAATAGNSPMGASIIASAFVVYGVLLIVGSFSQMYIYAWSTNYCFIQSELGDLRFESTLSGGKLFWIRISNIAAIVFSMGLLTPWAKVRRMRYLAENLSVVSTQDLENFTSAVAPDAASYGDAAADFFDLEIGL